MALSQKHSGLILVPWFNLTEWQLVYDYIYTTPNWAKALEILEVWKIRTPLLSAGVEGTLIILEALSVDLIKLSDFEITHIFSTCLIRFLNICATNSDKQGTFYKTAKQNDLPKWLITLRHDIAHGQKVPSRSMLEIGIKFSLDWIKDKYWDVQLQFMTDLVIQKTKTQELEDCIMVYIHLKYFLYSNPANSKLEWNLKNHIRKLFPRRQNNLKDVLKIVFGRIKDLIDNDLKNAAALICDILVNKFFILNTTLQINPDDKLTIFKDFINNWSQLLNFMFEKHILPCLTNELFDFICDETKNDLRKEVASLWISVIYQALLNGKSFKGKENELQFNVNGKFFKDDNFVMKLLQNPNKFSSIFLRDVMEFNDFSNEFIEKSLYLMKAFTVIELQSNDSIFTVNDLNLELDDVKRDDNIVELCQFQTSNRWRKVKDSSLFNRCPLGVLPYQSRSKNPIFEY